MTGKRLGILTSGGDCPGLNSVIRTVVSHATLTYGWEVLGIPYGTQGLREGHSIALNLHGLDLHGIDPLLSLGGTILGTINRGDTLAHIPEMTAGYQALGLDALIAVGGDGSLSILRELALQGNWPLVGIPKTIDNDVALTERAVGFDTAVNTVLDALERLSSTAASHDRVMVVEVMGRTTGHLALQAGIAGGADCILIPEMPYTLANLRHHLGQLRDRWGRRCALVVVAEGVKTLGGTPSTYVDSLGQERLRGIGEYIVEHLTHTPAGPIEARVTILGHVQRGGCPTAADRLLAAQFGQRAVDLVAEGVRDCMVAWQAGQVEAVPLAEVVRLSPARVQPDSPLLATAQALGIYLGDGVGTAVAAA